MPYNTNVGTIATLAGDGIENLRSDGNAVDVTSNAAYDKGDVVYQENFFGIAMEDCASGDTLAIEIQQREFEIVIPNGLTGAKGGILYLDATGIITETITDKPFLKVTKAKNTNDAVWGILLPQYTDTV